MLRAGDLILVGEVAIVLQILTGGLANVGQVLIVAALVTVIWYAVARSLDCYDLAVATDLPTALGRVGAALAAAATLLVLLPPWLAGDAFDSLGGAPGLALFAAVMLAWRTAYAMALGSPRFCLRALIVDQDMGGMDVAKLLIDAEPLGYRIVRLVTCVDRPTHDARFAEDLIREAQRHRVHEVIVGTRAHHSAGLSAALTELAGQGIKIVTAAEVYESLTRRVLPGWRDGVWLTQVSASSANLLYAAVRRAADVVCAVAGLAVAAPLLPLVALVIKLDSTGPVLYWQERVGRYGAPFRMVKLRTMRNDAEASGRPQWAQSGDPRVTRVGALLRRTRLDEVPQLWNVLRGEMSLIGPRPERPSFVQLLTSQIPMYSARHLVRPGITGWAQVQYRYGASVEDAATKLAYDLYYIRHQSPWLDLAILVKTVAVVLRCKGI